MKTRTYSALLVCGLLSMLMAVACVLSWRMWRQSQLDQALMAAIYNSQAASVQSLLDAGANPNTHIGREGMPSFWRFLPSHRADFVLHDKSCCQSHETETALFVVVEEEGDGSEYIVGMEPKRNNPKYEPIKAAMVRALLRHGARVEDRSGDETPLMEALQYNRAGSAEALVEAGADVNAHSKSGKTVLMYSAACTSTRVQERLLAKGASVSAQDDNGFTPLIHAAHHANSALTALLLQHGAPVNAVTKNGQTALLEAAQWGDSKLVCMLLDYGADLHASSASGDTALLLTARDTSSERAELLLQHGAAPNVSNAYGETPLMEACQGGSTETVRLLLAHGADANATDAKGETIVVRAVNWGGKTCMQQVRLLLAHGARLNVRNRRERTLLQLAKASNLSISHELTHLLQQAGAKE